MIRNEFGGINDSFYTLYAITGNSQYKFLARFFYHNDVLDPLYAGEDILEGMHANTYIPKLVGLCRGYELGENTEYREIADFFWNTVVDHHSFVTGSNSDREKFFAPDKISEHLSGYTGESCNVYNMLKLTRHLFSYDPRVKYADFYERVLFNHISGQQDPATGMIAYFLPMLPGAHKVYSTPDSSFWCCVGTGFENHAKYGEAIYYHDDTALFVNLFIPSELSWTEKSFKLGLETDFPDNGRIRIIIKEAPDEKVAVNLRYPGWAPENVTVKLNDKRIRIDSGPGEYISVIRKWKKEDLLEMELPMHLRLIPANDDPELAAIAWGPVILAGEMGTKGMIKPAPYSNPDLHNDYYTYDYRVPGDISNKLRIDPSEPESYIIKDESRKEPVFRSKYEGIILSPLKDIHRQRYNVYWRINDPSE
jgi:DUF1680 family protein